VVIIILVNVMVLTYKEAW